MFGTITKKIRNSIWLRDNTDIIHKAIIKGNLRQNDFSLMVGDRVHYLIEDEKYIIDKVYDRFNQLDRPNICNINYIFVVQSTVEPTFSTFLLSKMMALYESKGVEVDMIITKTDIEKIKDENIIKNLKDEGYFVVDGNNEDDIKKFKKVIKGKTICLVGNSGVGKSTFINKLDPSFNLKTNEISKALNRGKHTTTYASIMVLGDGYIVDTPGFSTIEFKGTPQELAKSFYTFNILSKLCRYTNCLHDTEDRCNVKAAVDDKFLPQWRYNDYLKILREIKDVKNR